MSVVAIRPLIVIAMASVTSSLIVASVLPLVLTVVNRVLGALFGAFEFSVVLRAVVLIPIFRALVVFWPIVIIVVPLLIF